MPKGGKLYDEEDMEDDWEEEEEWDEADAWDDPPSKPNQNHQTKAGGHVSTVRKEPVAAVQQRQQFPLAPRPAHPASRQQQQPPVPSFDFGTPSPDDLITLAQQGKAGSSPGAGARNNQPGVSDPAPPAARPKLIHLPPSKAMMQKPPLQAADNVQTATSGMAGLGIHAAAEGAGSSESWQAPSTSTAEATAQEAAQRVCARRRMADYSMEPDLARECASAAALEQPEASSSGSPADPGGGGAARKPGLHLVVLGHVDAGKSTLMGRLLFELGHITQKDVHRNQRDAAVAGKASFSWAWVLDERPEERSRGVTVDVATSRFQTPKFVVTLLDAPGHKDFVPNMIGGAAAADAALLLVDGSVGGFEAGFEAADAGGGGQTREHAQLARSLGVEQVAVVVSKLDMVDNPQERFEHIQSVLGPFLLSTCGFRPANVQWLPAVGPSGQNLVAPPTEAPLAGWWKGPTLAQAIDGFKARERLTGKPLRLPVSDVFKNKAGALVAAGKVEAGALRVGTKVLVAPGQAAGSIRAIEVGGQAVPLARAGDAVELALAGVDVGGIPSGAVLCHPEYPVPLVTKFELRVVVLDVAVPILKGQSTTLHAHVAREVGHISALIGVLSPRSGEITKAKPRCLLKGQTALIEVTCPRGLCLEEYADLKALGRVALRDGGRTLAVGVVTRLSA